MDTNATPRQLRDVTSIGHLHYRMYSIRTMFTDPIVRRDQRDACSLDPEHRRAQRPKITMSA